MDTMSEIPGFLTIQEVAERLDKDHSTICRYIRNGKLPAKKVGNAKLIHEATLKTFTPPEAGNPLLKKRN